MNLLTHDAKHPPKQEKNLVGAFFMIKKNFKLREGSFPALIFLTQEYPWPTGKAPWSVERGGTGIPPDRARENWGRNRSFEEQKPVVVDVVRGKQRGGDKGGLPSAESVRRPQTQAEAGKMIELSQKLLELGLQFVGQQLSQEVR